MGGDRYVHRSLVLVGGLRDAAFQAGALEVWLDEAGIGFDHVDASGGGCLNAAMWARGMDGREIADRWRDLDPAMLDFVWADSADPLLADSLFTLEGWREGAFALWGLDERPVRKEGPPATLRLFDLTRLEPVTRDARKSGPSELLAAISAPGWLPPVPVGDGICVDAGFAVGGSLDEAIRRGAEEVWVVAPTSVAIREDALPGVLMGWGRLVEVSSIDRLKGWLERIAAGNAALARGGESEFGRRIRVRLLAVETPGGFPADLDRDRLAEVVARGVECARAWCREQGVPLRRKGRVVPTAAPARETVVRIHEVLRGRLEGSTNGTKPGSRGEAVECRLRIRIEDATRFLDEEEIRGRVTGEIRAPEPGGARRIEDGSVTFHRGEHGRGVVYRLPYRYGERRVRTFLIVRIPGGEADDDLLEGVHMEANVLEGRVGPGGEASARVVAQGTVAARALDRLRQIVTMRASGGSEEERAVVLSAFGRHLHGDVWEACVGRLRDRPGRPAAEPPERRVSG